MGKRGVLHVRVNDDKMKRNVVFVSFCKSQRLLANIVDHHFSFYSYSFLAPKKRQTLGVRRGKRWLPVAFKKQ